RAMNHHTVVLFAVASAFAVVIDACGVEMDSRAVARSKTQKPAAVLLPAPPLPSRELLPTRAGDPTRTAAPTADAQAIDDCAPPPPPTPPTEGEPEGPAAINSFDVISATPTSAALAWTTTNATSCTLTLDGQTTDVSPNRTLVLTSSTEHGLQQYILQCGDAI